MFSCLGPWCHDHRRLVLGLWIGLLVLIGATAGAVGAASRDEFSLPNVESRHGFDILNDQFGGQGAGQIGTIVFRADQGVNDPEVKQQMEAFFAEVAAIPDVVRVDSPYVPGTRPQVAFRDLRPGDRVRERRAARQDLVHPCKRDRQGDPTADAAHRRRADRVRRSGLRAFEPPSSEVLGLAFAIIILILAFGSVLAMGLPVGTRRSASASASRSSPC